MWLSLLPRLLIRRLSDSCLIEGRLMLGKIKRSLSVAIECMMIHIEANDIDAAYYFAKWAAHWAHISLAERES